MGSTCSGDCDGDRNTVDIDIKRRPPDEQIALLDTDNPNLIKKHSLTDSNDDPNSHYRLPGSEPLDTSKSSLPTIKVTVAPILAQRIFLHKTFEDIRKRKEESAIKLYDGLTDILFQTDCWQIRGSDGASLNSYRSLFEIVIWRIPVIPTFAHFKNDKELYDKLHIDIDKAEFQIEGIWSVITKASFVEMFEKESLKDIDHLHNAEACLANETNYRPNSKDYNELVDKLKKLDGFKKNNEIIIVGQRDSVTDFIRKIRVEEVNHPSSAPHLIDDDDLDYMRFNQDADPKIIRSYHCIIENIPLQSTQTDLLRYFDKYKRITYVSLIEDESNNDNETDEKEQEIEYLEAKIEFDTKEAMQVLIDDLESDIGLYMGDNPIVLKDQKQVDLKRKQRRLFAGRFLA